MNELLTLVERIVEKKYKGYTVIHQSGKYRAMWGLPDDVDNDAEAIKKIPPKATLKEALIDLVADTFTEEPRRKPYSHASAL